MKIQTQLLYCILNILPKDDGDQPQIQIPGAQIPGANFDPRVLREALDHHWLQEAIKKEMRAISRYVCKNVMDNVVLRLKKCTEMNGGHLEQML